MGRAGATPIGSRGTGGCSIGKQPQLTTLLLNSASSSALLFHQIQETRCADLLFNKSAAKGCEGCSGNPVKDLVWSPAPLGWGSSRTRVRIWKSGLWRWHSLGLERRLLALAQLCLWENDFEVKRRRERRVNFIFSLPGLQWCFGESLVASAPEWPLHTHM